jgi:hypothetical protein
MILIRHLYAYNVHKIKLFGCHRQALGKEEEEKEEEEEK